jgi:hypothetical protein
MKKITPLQEEVSLKIGASEFQSNKHTMLDIFELAKIQNRHRPTQIDKGKIAEAAFRDWLTQFLPRKFAVTSGYIISQGINTGNKLLHYDVIIYDAINSPILWVENNADNSEQGKVRAIPAEHVNCVIEVKPTFNLDSCKKAKLKLWELAPLLENTDAPDEIYKMYLPLNFSIGIIFFEILESERFDLRALSKLMPLKTTSDLRGYFGGIILQAENRDRNITGKISFGVSDNKIPEFGDLNYSAMAGNIITSEGKYFSTMIDWSSANFVIFAFDLIAWLNGTYRNGFVSSFHGVDIPVVHKGKII